MKEEEIPISTIKTKKIVRDGDNLIILLEDGYYFLLPVAKAQQLLDLD